MAPSATRPADTIPEPERVAVVVAGAGARGGYEAGVLSVLVPHLRATGHDDLIFVGTSAGAINAALFAGFAHLEPGAQADAVLAIWKAMKVSDVFRSPVLNLPHLLADLAGQQLRVRGRRLTGLLDTTPLAKLAERSLDWQRLSQNIDEGLATLAVVTTSGADNRTVVFVDRAGKAPIPQPDDERPIDYARARIGADHVLGSAAIPVAFPPQRITEPDERKGWYIDGGVRLNAPLKPAIALGADGLVVVATHPEVGESSEAPERDGSTQPPDVDDTLVRLLDAALVDRMVEDVRTLGKVNEGARGKVSARATGSANGRSRKHAIVPYLAVGPQARGTLGELAAKVFKEGGVATGLRPHLRARELQLLGRFLLGDGPRSGDLLSYLYFDAVYVEESIKLGQADARAVLAGAGGLTPWRIGTSPEPAPRKAGRLLLTKR